MAFAKGWDKETDITFGKDWDAEKMLRLYIYNYMKKKGLHDVADIFAKEANLELFEVLDSDYGFLKEWWELFWPQFCSRLANKAGGNSQSSAQPSMQDAFALLSSLKNQGATGSQQTPIGNPQNVIPTPVTNQRMIASGGSSVVNVMGQPQGATGFQQTPIGDPQHNVIPTPVTNQRMIASGGSSVVNVMGQRPVSLLQTPPGVSRRKAGKRPVNTDTARILGKLSTQAIRKGPLGFPPVKLLPTQLPFDVNQMPYTTPPPPSGNLSNLHLPVTMQSPVEVTGDPRNDVAERSDQMESNRLGRNSAYPPPGLHAGLYKTEMEHNNTRFYYGNSGSEYIHISCQSMKRNRTLL